MQFFLAANREQLAERGVCYPRPPDSPDFAHHSVAWRYVREYNPDEGRPAGYGLEDALAAYRDSGCDTLLLSSEDFLVPTFYDGFMPEFCARLRDHFERIVVTAYVRDRQGFFTASYNQWVKSLSYAGHFADYIAQMRRSRLASMHYTRALLHWGEHADRAVFLPFSRGTDNGVVERRLLAALGFEGASMAGFEDAPTGAANPSMGPLAVLAWRRLRTRLEATAWFDYNALGPRARLLEDMHREADRLGWNDERFAAFDEDSLAAIRAVYHEDDERFARRFFKAPWDSVFPDEQALGAVTERDYASLSGGERQSVDDFEGFALARAEAHFRERSSH